jgi:plasmid stabilization system protein ParE
MQITILPSAQEDLNTIFEYIARDSIFYAEQVNTRIMTTIGYFYACPRMGKQIKDNPETREYV